MNPEELKKPVTEKEIGELMHHPDMLQGGRDIIRRLAFERDQLKGAAAHEPFEGDQDFDTEVCGPAAAPEPTQTDRELVRDLLWHREMLRIPRTPHGEETLNQIIKLHVRNAGGE